MAVGRMTLDSPALAGRLRTHSGRTAGYERRAVVRVRPRLVHDIHPAAIPKPAPPRANAQNVASPRPRPVRSSVLKRSTVRPPARRRFTGLRFSSKKVSLAFAALLFLFGIGVGVDGLRANKEVVAQVQSLQHRAAEGNTDSADDDGAAGDPVVAPDIPAEDKGPDVDAYRAAADLPRALYIPRFEVKARVLQVGTTRDGAIASPANILDTGWFKESAKPGQNGAMLIDGHVHGPTKPGVFYNLKKLRPGDAIQLERGDGTRFSYRVVNSKTYPADAVDMGAALRSATAGKPGLNLITCTGAIDRETNSYKDRLVVFAVQD